MSTCDILCYDRIRFRLANYDFKGGAYAFLSIFPLCDFPDDRVFFHSARRHRSRYRDVANRTNELSGAESSGDVVGEIAGIVCHGLSDARHYWRDWICRFVRPAALRFASPFETGDTARAKTNMTFIASLLVCEWYQMTMPRPAAPGPEQAT
jgi:hypothetical protein